MVHVRGIRKQTLASFALWSHHHARTAWCYKTFTSRTSQICKTTGHVQLLVLRPASRPHKLFCTTVPLPAQGELSPRALCTNFTCSSVPVALVCTMLGSTGQPPHFFSQLNIVAQDPEIYGQRTRPNPNLHNTEPLLHVHHLHCAAAMDVFPQKPSAKGPRKKIIHPQYFSRPTSTHTHPVPPHYMVAGCP